MNLYETLQKNGCENPPAVLNDYLLYGVGKWRDRFNLTIECEIRKIDDGAPLLTRRRTVLHKVNR